MNFTPRRAQDVQVLSDELSRTALGGSGPLRSIFFMAFASIRRRGQRFKLSPTADEGGPAFLIYYAPALMQKNCGKDPVRAIETRSFAH